MRAVAGQLATVRHQFATDDGTAVVPDRPPSVTVTGGDGTVILPATAGTADVTLGDGGYKAVMVAPAQLDRLTATWTATIGGLATSVRDDVDVVGQRLVAPLKLRNDDVNLSGLSPVSLLTLLDQVEDRITNILGYSPTLEGARVTWDATRGATGDAVYSPGTVTGLPYGAGGGRMLVPTVRLPCTRPPGGVYAASVNGAAMTAADLAALTDIDGALAWSDYRPWPTARYAMWLAHGDPSPGGDLRDAAQRLCVYYAKTSAYPAQASQVSSEGATIWFALPSKDRPTGIPEVDGVLTRYGLTKVV